MTEAILPLHIDSTMRSAFVSCGRKGFLEFCLGLRSPGISVDLHAGGCFAKGIEVYYREVFMNNAEHDVALARAHVAFMQEWGDFEIPEFKKTAKTKDRMWEAVEDYIQHYGAKTDHVQPYFAADGKPTFEYTFAIPLEPAIDPTHFECGDGKWGRDYMGGNEQSPNFPAHPSGAPFLYCGRFDMLGNLHGKPVVRDEKTTGSSIGASWPEQWNLRAQFMGYVWACQQAGIDLDTVVVRGIAIQKTQIVHAEAIKTYSKFMLERWKEQLRRDLWRLRRQWDEGYFDYNFGEACTSYGGCHFATICTSPQPENWFSDFTVRRWNPLEKNPVKEEQSNATEHT